MSYIGLLTLAAVGVAQLSYPSAYRLSRSSGGFGRLHANTLDRLCAFFKVQPGELLRWTPAKSGRPL
jgi:Cro/C1-type HTH DNA-binding domain